MPRPSAEVLVLRNLILVSMFVLAFSTLAHAKTVTVQPPGDDSNALSAGVSQLVDGDTLVIEKGRYTGSLLLIDLKDITVLAAKGVVVVTRPGLETLLVSGCTNISLTGLDLTSNTTNVATITNSSNVTLSKCRLSDGTSAGARVVQSGAVTFDKCVINGGSVGVSIQEASGVTISRCRLNGQSSGVVVDALPASAGIVVSRSRIADSTGYGVSIGSGDAQIDRNRVTGCGGGIELLTDAKDCVVERNNVVKTTAQHGLRVACSGSRVTRNQIRKTTRSGVVIESGSTGITLERNGVRASTQFGVEVRADGVTLIRNRVAATVLAGFLVSADDGTWERNSTLGAGQNGFHVTHSACVFTKNRGRRSYGFDLQSMTPRSQNEYVDNQFGITSFPLEN